MEIHDKYMKRCFNLALNGLGNTYPNPLVGSVIVYNGKIIGEGYHTQSGENHAEINAINSVKNKSLLRKSTIYVSLEPCSHYGKTPPCAKTIANLKIPRVVIGTIDTTDKVAGKGIKILKNAGIEVIVGVLNAEAREINKRFFTFHEKKRPYIILKWAQTIDGFIDPVRNCQSPIEPFWITGEHERQLVHKWRAQEQAILIGKNTAYNDNPSLTTRNWYGNNPIRILLDRQLQIKNTLKIYDNSSKTIVFNNKITEEKSKNIQLVKIDKNTDELKQLFYYFYTQNIQSVIIEGGKKTIQTFYDSNFWDEARIFIGNKFFNKGVRAPKIDFSNTIVNTKFKNSNLFYLLNL